MSGLWVSRRLIWCSLPSTDVCDGGRAQAESPRLRDGRLGRPGLALVQAPTSDACSPSREWTTRFGERVRCFNPTSTTWSHERRPRQCRSGPDCAIMVLMAHGAAILAYINTWQWDASGRHRADSGPWKRPAALAAELLPPPELHYQVCPGQQWGSPVVAERLRVTSQARPAWHWGHINSGSVSPPVQDNRPPGEGGRSISADNMHLSFFPGPPMIRGRPGK